MQLNNTVSSKPFSQAFSAGLPLPAALDPHLEEALRHVLDNPGSLIRPRMIYQMATAYGLQHDSAKDLAIALEYFHTASLLFDDLPCMDNATERRGVPCVHLAYGEAGAILAALALINRAYAMSWRAVSGASPQIQSRALDIYRTASRRRRTAQRTEPRPPLRNLASQSPDDRNASRAAKRFR